MEWTIGCNKPALAIDQHSSFSAKHRDALAAITYSVSDKVTYWLFGWAKKEKKANSIFNLKITQIQNVYETDQHRCALFRSSFSFFFFQFQF